MDELNELENEDDPRHFEWSARERCIPTEAHVGPISLEQVLLKGTGTKTAAKKKSQTPSNRKKPKPAEKVEEVTVEVILETTGSDDSQVKLFQLFASD